jgi:hypothetical protein
MHAYPQNMRTKAGSCLFYLFAYFGWFAVKVLFKSSAPASRFIGSFPNSFVHRDPEPERARPRAQQRSKFPAAGCFRRPSSVSHRCGRGRPRSNLTERRRLRGHGKGKKALRDRNLPSASSGKEKRAGVAHSLVFCRQPVKPSFNRKNGAPVLMGQ